jgi:hypothetical protein
MVINIPTTKLEDEFGRIGREGEVRNTYKIFVRKLQGKILFEAIHVYLDKHKFLKCILGEK